MLLGRGNSARLFILLAGSSLIVVQLHAVDRTNWRQTLQLAVAPHQQRFIADYFPVAGIALAKAYIRPDDMVWIPYAIYADEQMVGFVEIAYNVENPDSCWIYHFFI